MSSFWSCRSPSCISSRCPFFSPWLNGPFSLTCVSWESPSVATSSCCPSVYSNELSSWSGLDLRSSWILGTSGFGSLSLPVSSNTDGSLIVGSTCWSCRSRSFISSRFPFFSSWLNGPFSSTCFSWESPSVETSSCCPSVYSSELSSWSGLDLRGSSILDTSGLGSSFWPVSSNSDGSWFVGSTCWSCRPRYCISSRCPFFSSWVNGPFSSICFCWESPSVAASSGCLSVHSSELSSWSGLDFRGFSMLDISGFGSSLWPILSNTDGSLFVVSSCWLCRSRSCFS